VRHANSMSTLLSLWRRIKLLCGEEVEEGGMPTACQLSCCYGVELNCCVERKWKRVRHANSMSTLLLLWRRIKLLCVERKWKSEACQQHVNSLAVMA
jgi:hypothetical protein